jgi:LysW-gamma-L-lysine carboxypeptidase
VSPDDGAAADLLEAMLAIPSPSGGEEALAQFVAGALVDLGLAGRVDDAGNVLGTTGTGRGPTVMLLSHLDTVDDPLPPRRVADRLFGRGAVDAKGPLAAMICAAARSQDFPGTLVVVGAVEEERLSRGAHHLASTVAPPDFLVVGEPSGWQGVVLGYKGKADLIYEVRRPATHSTNPFAKASEVAVRFWEGLVDALGPEPSHRSFSSPAATLRRIEADARHAVVDVDCRLPVGFDVEQLLERLRELEAGGHVTLVRAVPAVRAARDDPVARCLSAGIRLAGGEPRPLLKTGTSDMNTLASEGWTMPMAAYGPGDSTMDHAAEESIEIDEYLRAVRVLEAALQELVRPAEGGGASRRAAQVARS